MSNIKIAGFQSNLFEELNDADLVAVTGGGLLGGLLGTVTDFNNTVGNGGRPTTGTVGVVTTTLGATTTDLNNINGGLEGGFQVLNAGVTGLGNDLG
ncbi:hypothetical protein H6G81_15575 [Scytonema hofmannii FACHB-248]|uniref:Uncharacterized protein n=1 Tax=Scytonema hofmannii FACHB-248 TaxID=1842502 RepID=A0ABR8GS81_9CYAN|nr:MULTISPECIES: hypothetical protein [Nostocales]MBD2605900.1 hypothetical protein [Scytonema hofmannii FACHB-248]